jgi:hypothetical protein
MPAKMMMSKRQRKQQRKPRTTPLSGVVTTRNIFPPLFRGKLFYDTVIALSPAAGATSTYVFRGNSVFDPDFTGVGASARTYSNLAALYGRYRVMGFRATITFVNTSTTTPVTTFVVLSPATTVGVDIAQILAQRQVWTRSISASNGAGTVTHTFSAPVSKIYGVPESQVRTEDDFAAVTGANPNNGVYIHVGGYANGASAGAFNFHVRIEYDVIWSLPLQF